MPSVRGVETSGEACRAAVPASGARARGAWSSCWRRKRAHLLSVPETGFLLCKSPVPGRRPRGSRRCRLLCVPPTPGGRVRPSGSSAHGAESPRPWRPQPPFRPRSPEQHLHAGQPQLRLASTFGPAQYNPAAPRGGGAWAQTERGGERGGPGGRSSGAGAHQAGATRRRGSRLFVLGPLGPALRLPPMGSARAAAVRACARECACPRARPPGRGPCALELTEAIWANGHGWGAPVRAPGGVGARGLPQLHAVCWLLWGLKRCCFLVPTPLVAAGGGGRTAENAQDTLCSDRSPEPHGVSFLGLHFEDRLCLVSFFSE